MLKAPIVVFVRPQAEGNIGALARVMSNFGVTELRLVGESPVFKFKEGDPFSRMDWAMATKRGEGVLQNKKWYPDLSAALCDVQVAIGSSGRSTEFDRGYARPLVSPQEAFHSARDFETKVGSKKFQWAFVLGPEDDGLNDHESALCQKLIRLSTVDTAPSINAAMAAGCILYHWHLTNLEGEKDPTRGEVPMEAGPFLVEGKAKRFSEEGRSQWSSHQQKERFLDYLMETISKTQFLKYPDQDAVRARVRRWLQVAPIPVGELLFAFEIVYHLRAWGSGTFESRDFLGRE